MAIHGRTTLTKIQNGIDTLKDFRAGNVRGELYRDWHFVPKGRLYDYIDRDKKFMHSGHVYVVFSYGTPIAWTFDVHLDANQNRAWVQPDVRYSVTTSAHQSRVAVAIANPSFYPLHR